MASSVTYGSDKTAGFFRQAFGKEYKYYDLDGKVIRDKAVLDRIGSLKIPPAWKNVWVSPKENSHLQAVGYDIKNRKQYIYHPDWVKICQQNKFSKLADFGLSLPKLRQRVSYNMHLKGMDKRKILAIVVWLLEHTFVRIGNEEYLKENNSYGLTTLREKHVRISGPRISFAFRGKSGVENVLVVSNRLVAKTLKKSIELPGYELFKFIDQDGNRHVIDSEDVNMFLKDTTKNDFTAKDFRTWGATHLSANSFYKIGEPADSKMIKKNIVETVKKVASHLNNTVSVCRNYYIHPTVINTYEENKLIPHFSFYQSRNINKNGLSWNEYALIKLLQKY